MLKAFVLLIIGGIFIAGSCYRWDRVSDSGVISQEICRDNPIPGCKNPEDFKDSVVVDSVTGDTVVVSREMFKGKPNGKGWIWFVVGSGLILYGLYSGYEAQRDRKEKLAKKEKP